MKKPSFYYGASIKEALLSNRLQVYNVNINQSESIDQAPFLCPFLLLPPSKEYKF